MNKMSMKIRRIITILVTVLMISQLPGVGYIISGAADGPMISEPVGTLTHTCTAEDEGRTFSMFYQSLATLIVPADLGVTIGAVEITDSVNAGASFTINNNGHIETANIQYGQVSMNGGTYTSITLAEGATINATGITATSSITSSGSFNVEGNNVSNGSVTAVSIGGTGNITVKEKLELTGSGTTAKMYVYADTQIVNSTGAAFAVTNVENNKKYSIPAGTNSTLREMHGTTMDISSEDNRASGGVTSEFFEPLWYGESTPAATFEAAEGYYFPEDYQVTTDGQGAVTTDVVEKNKVSIAYTVGADDTGTVTLTFPALTRLPSGEGNLVVENVRYNEEVNPQITSSTNDATYPLFEYKQKDATDDAYTTTKPTAVGDYVVRATLPCNLDYYTLVLEKEFSILRAIGSVDFSIADVTYGVEVNPQLTSDTNDVSTAVIEYKLVTEDDATYSVNKPTTVGNYIARVTLLQNEIYESVVETTEFSITRAQGSAEFSVASVKYNQLIIPVVASTTHDVSTSIIEYKPAAAEDTEYSADKPTAVGDYVARVTLPENDSYQQVVRTTEFSITKATGTVEFSIEDVKYGVEVKPQVKSDTNDVSTAIVEYKLTSEDDESFTTVKPVKVGEYTARVTLIANESYEQLVETTTFSIKKAKGSVRLVLENIVYGEILSPEIYSETNDVNTAVIEYKSVGEDDSAYSTTKVSAVGEYMLRVTLSESESYEQVVETATFSIKKADGNGTINVEDVFYGAPVSPELASGTNDVYKALIEYKVAGAEDSTYSTVIPIAVGDYVARVTYIENDSYNQVVDTDEFTISYLPAPTVAVKISGTEGSNGYFTTAVTISAPEGYLISDRLDGDYATSITIDATRKAGYLYYKNIETGEKTAGVWQDEIMIDRQLPSATAKDGVTYYAEFVEVIIEDSNLNYITVNGEEYQEEIIAGKATIKLESNNGLEEYEIVIADLAGNTKVMKVVVADNWMEQGVIPTGENVSLMTEYEYSLGEGIWQVEGDTTSYNGNNSFYVGVEGEYTFVQQ